MLFLISNIPIISGQICLLNTWCRPSVSNSFPATEYKLIVRNEGMNWFEALHLCHREGKGSELLSIDSADEREWVVRAVHGVDYDEYGVNSDNSWHVNAHQHLYNTKWAAWANGRAIDANLDRESGFYSITKSTMWCGGSRTVVNECFSLFFASPSWRLENIDCNRVEIKRAICKRPTIQQNQPAFSPKEKFNQSEWIQSPNNENISYRIINVEQTCKRKSNWYCARLLCSSLGASLTDIESQANYNWLWRQINSSYSNENRSSETFYYVDLHRYLYDQNKWTWGGPHKNSSFNISVFSESSQESCRELCATIRYAGGSLESMSASPVYCAEHITQSRAVCKKVRIQVGFTLSPKTTPSLLISGIQPLNQLIPSSSAVYVTTLRDLDWFQRLELIGGVPFIILLLTCSVAVAIVFVCFIALCFFCVSTRFARTAPASNRGGAGGNPGRPLENTYGYTYAMSRSALPASQAVNTTSNETGNGRVGTAAASGYEMSLFPNSTRAAHELNTYAALR